MTTNTSQPTPYEKSVKSAFYRFVAFGVIFLALNYWEPAKRVCGSYYTFWFSVIGTITGGLMIYSSPEWVKFFINFKKIKYGAFEMEMKEDKKDE